MANGRIKTASFGPAFVGVILIFCAFAVVAWILFRFIAPSADNENKREENRLAKSAAIAQEAQDKLYSPAKWIDKAKGTVQLPIDTAMDLVVADYQTKAVQPSSVPVDNPYPIGLGAIMPGATPAVTGSAAAPATSGTVAAPAKPASSPAAAAQPAASTIPEVKP